MGKVYGLDGKELNTEPERVTPTINLDTPEGRFTLPVVLLAGMQFDTLRDQVIAGVLEEVLPLLYEQMSLPFEEGNLVSGEVLPPE